MVLNKDKWSKIQTLQKGTHLISRIHKPVEDLIVYLLYDLEFIGADHISIITYILAAGVVYYLIDLQLIPALALAVIVGILDGVDGKIARLRGKKTYIGKLEHSFDMLYEQLWYVGFTIYFWWTTNNFIFIILGLIWLVVDGYVRHIYNVVWIATGKSLKYHGKIGRYVTFIDGRRSVYILHIIFWLILLMPWNAMYTILGHSVATATSYTILSFKVMGRV
jgi:phosphatidylglycerophosphate synthase